MNRLAVALFSVGLFGCGQQHTHPVPQINIIDHDNLGWEEKKPCGMEYNPGKASETSFIDYKAKGKLRGGVSTRYFKHSYTIKLGDKRSIGNLPADNDWIINASYIDRTLIRHKLCYDLFRAMGTPNIAPQCTYAEVSLDGSYNGLYVIMERMDVKRLNLMENDPDAFIFKDPPLFRTERERLQSSEQTEDNYYHQKVPNVDITDHNFLLDSIRTVLLDAPDSIFMASFERWFDEDNIVDWHILLLVTNNGDGLVKNFYLYRQSGSDKIKIAPWDYDHSFGRDADGELNLNKRWKSTGSLLFNRLLQNPSNVYRDRFSSRYTELRQNGTISTPSLHDHIERNATRLRPVIAHNFERWPTNSEHYPDQNNFEQELELMKQWIEPHLIYCDSLIEAL